MFSEFFTFIRVAFAASQIEARHTRPKAFQLAYHHPLEQSLFDALNGTSSGVFVHWGVYESGKTTAVREMAWRLQEEAGRQVIVLQGYDFPWQRPMSAWLRRSIGVPDDMMQQPLSQFFSKPATTLVIDHLDVLMRDKDDCNAETLALVCALMHESERTKKFNVLLVLNSWERAQELVNAGCQLRPRNAHARWTREQLEALFDAMPAPVRDQVGAKKQKDRLLRFSAISGTPGYLTYEAHSDHISPEHAAMHDLEWRMGAKALYDEGAALPPGTVGRFPDKNGRYHHEDLASVKAPDIERS